jgi:hypothetical protein
MNPVAVLFVLALLHLPVQVASLQISVQLVSPSNDVLPPLPAGRESLPAGRQCGAGVTTVRIGTPRSALAVAGAMCGSQSIGQDGLFEVGNCYVDCAGAGYAGNGTAAATAAAEAAVRQAATEVGGWLAIAAPAVVNVVNPADACLFDFATITGYYSDRPNDPMTISQPSFAVNQTSYPGADFVLFLTFRPTMKPDPVRQYSGMTTVTGRTCSVNGPNGRPDTGHLNVDPVKFAAMAPSLAATEIRRAIVQALGFGAAHFAAKGLLTTATLVDTSKFNRYMANGTMSKGVTYLTGPNVQREARAHFGCDDLQGAELEDGTPLDGNPSSFFNTLYVNRGLFMRGIHFERRIFGPELMTSGVRPDAKRAQLSRLTLAALQDLTWYDPDYSKADATYAYGKNQGCGFVRSSCATMTCAFDSNGAAWRRAPECRTTQHLSGYFSQGNATTCSYDYTYRATGTDSINYVSSLPDGYNYYSKLAEGGLSIEADMCPLTQFDASGDCTNPATSVTAKRGEIVGPGSKCVMSSINLGNQGGVSSLNTPAVPTCVKYRCMADGSIAFQVGGVRANYWYTCQPGSAGMALDIYDINLETASGFFVCPQYAAFCNGVANATAAISITSVNPLKGDIRGGTRVTITGKNFPDVGPNLVVEVGGVPVASSPPCTVSTDKTTLECTTGVGSQDTLSFTRVMDKSKPDDGAFLGSSFQFETPPPPSPQPSPPPVKKRETNFFKKSCIGVPCFIIPIVFLGLTIPCCIYACIRGKTKKPKEEKKKIILAEDEEGGVQL